MDRGHDVLAAGLDRAPRAGAQRDVQRRPVLGDVHVLAGEQRGDPLLQARLARERDEQRRASAA